MQNKIDKFTTGNRLNGSTVTMIQNASGITVTTSRTVNYRYDFTRVAQVAKVRTLCEFSNADDAKRFFLQEVAHVQTHELVIR